MKKDFFLVSLLVFLVVALAGCLDRSDHYRDIADARRGRVFDKGWLPDILPPSSRKIVVKTSVEAAAGRGIFTFNCDEYHEFFAKLSSYDGSKSKIESDNRLIEKMIMEDNRVGMYGSSTSRWIFICTPSMTSCHFFVWQPQ